MSRTNHALFRPQPESKWVRSVVRRTDNRLRDMDLDALQSLLEDARYSEKRRLERDDASAAEVEAMQRLSNALVRGTRTQQIDAALHVVGSWVSEIHGNFNPRVYGIATNLIPQALTALLSEKPRGLGGWRTWDLSISRRLKIEGEIDWIKELSEEATLILAPTHVSNMDSPLIGMALYEAGLPPFVYGAGLNLFSNPLLGWWLRRLGAYTVDRRKKAQLYKDTLKDYSVICLREGLHSLFFPGGTRCRSGAIETHLKKGLLGTGLQAWQENLATIEHRAPTATMADGRWPEVYVIPCTLSYQLVLEAPTLISDHLAEEGKQRYIINDDEFARPAEVAGFASRVLDLDSAVVCHFGAPMDVLGQEVPRDARVRVQEMRKRRRYVTNRAGAVEWDAQRDRVYTSDLASALTKAYHKNATVLSTHLVCRVLWDALSESMESTDVFRLVRSDQRTRTFERSQILRRLHRAMTAVQEGTDSGLFRSNLPSSAHDVLELAIDRFARFHRTRDVVADGRQVSIGDPRLCLYYRNRVSTIDMGA